MPRPTQSATAMAEPPPTNIPPRPDEGKTARGARRPAGAGADPASLSALRSKSPWALVSALRWRLRRAGLPPEEIERFSAEALAAGEPADLLEVCRRWAARVAERAWA